MPGCVGAARPAGLIQSDAVAFCYSAGIKALHCFYTALSIRPCAVVCCHLRSALAAGSTASLLARAGYVVGCSLLASLQHASLPPQVGCPVVAQGTFRRPAATAGRWRCVAIATNRAT
jgi:hypothetical protein